ncbi:UDP-N-acetylglucosamine 1-carboxyvinyltransferase [Paenibacillus caseinilyticus]|uniref:UDP-N-acetylglucosamine 1-carboxyvinyltransferase n=1 Tax=Paenibacillus mucilaginosus K02 TaxID=997761 RepID=I0BHM6_9BACL|nr:UDP-N-acetylglucosamine 1-carboxyvinyltransferase [Paenibacillus mucilaginosus]AFH61873.1 UDP-N-acetylglucosamine 1-carboxyvinyltransferase [Paenibacillus mucilaginosus K02]
MNYFEVEAAGRLHGEVRIPGSKNSSLALLAAACLADGIVTLEGIPEIDDVKVIGRIARDIGLSMQWTAQGELVLDPRYIHSAVIDPGKASSFRASYYFAGALLAKFGRVTVGFPGGDDFTSRPIDQHLKAFQALGAKVYAGEESYTVEAASLRGADIYFDTITSGATINAMLAAARARGTTNLYHAAVDPEVVDTAAFLNALGAKVYGAGTDRIRIVGVPYLDGGRHAVIPDRLIAGAFLMAAGMTGGVVTVRDVIPEHLGSCIAKLGEAGLELECRESSITAYGTEGVRAVRVRAAMYPGFATDLQQPMTALLTQAKGKSLVTDHVFPNRFNHVPQLRRLGAEIEVRGETAFIRGGRPLTGGWVHATDVRAGTCLILAGLAAEGVTRITGTEHIQRGYADVLGSFRALGAKITLQTGGRQEAALSSDCS